LKEIVFFPVTRHDGGMIGAFLNALGILAGALTGLTQRHPLSLRTQYFFKAAIGVFAVFFGMHLIWLSVSGTFFNGVKQLFLGSLTMVLGNWIGKLAGLQRYSNRLGSYAAKLLAAAQKQPPGKAGDGLLASSILFCAAPLGIIGAVVDGLSGYFYLLALKAVMDGLAMISFVKIFRWPAALAALPVVFFFDGIALATHQYAYPYLDAHHWTDAVTIVAGFVTCATSLVIFEVRRVELANYLPALFLAPLLTRWLY
jgi:uncharacterized membrane protein YqgA involved in biofilm formation